LQKYLYTEKFKISKPRMELALTRASFTLSNRSRKPRIANSLTAKARPRQFAAGWKGWREIFSPFCRLLGAK
jgi:hypothetical protein